MMPLIVCDLAVQIVTATHGMVERASSHIKPSLLSQWEFLLKCVL